MKQITLEQVALVRQAILEKRQGFKCVLCDIGLNVRTGVLDHDHHTGAIRGVLCRNCNGMEGKAKTIAIRGRRSLTLSTYLRKIADYWDFHQTDRTGLIYPTHLTPDQKRIKRNTKARKVRAKAKKG